MAGNKGQVLMYPDFETLTESYDEVLATLCRKCFNHNHNHNHNHCCYYILFFYITCIIHKIITTKTLRRAVVLLLITSLMIAFFQGACRHSMEKKLIKRGYILITDLVLKNLGQEQIQHPPLLGNFDSEKSTQGRSGSRQAKSQKSLVALY